MRQILLYVFLTNLVCNASAQNIDVSIKIPNKNHENDFNKIEEFVWSHPKITTSQRKPYLDFEAIENWIGLGGDKDLAISSDGKYFSYTTRYSSYKNWVIDSLIVQSTIGPWRKAFRDATPGFFSGDGMQYIFQSKDSLFILNTGGDVYTSIKQVVNLQKSPVQNVKWIAFNKRNGSVVLRELMSGNEKIFNDVSAYNFDASGKWLACQRGKELVLFNLENQIGYTFPVVTNFKLNSKGELIMMQIPSVQGSELICKDLNNGTVKTIWSTIDSTVSATNLNFDLTGTQLVFIKQNLKNPEQNSVWYWRLGMDKAKEMVGHALVGKDMMIKGEPLFTDNGLHIRFLLEKRPKVYKMLQDAVEIDVWNYKDSVSLATQLMEALRPELANRNKFRFGKYWGFVSLQSEHIIIEDDQEKVPIRLKQVTGDFIVLTKNGRNKGDRFWQDDYYLDSNWLVSLKDGSRTLLPVTKNDLSFWFSKNGRYFVYFIPGNGGDYFSYDLQTLSKTNISSSLPPGILMNKWDKYWPVVVGSNYPFGFACWKEGQGKVLVYDQFDIWQLDLTGKYKPINITNAYGRTHRIIFRMLGSVAGSISDPVHFEKTVLVKAYAMDNKYNGFYSITFDRSSNPELLYMGPCVTEKVARIIAEDMRPLKASQTNAWVIKRQSAVEAPNYFFTKDFKIYTPLTRVQPHKNYNWLISELHQFKQLDGTTNEGVLYKPENFDSSRKYPVIIAFYTALSDRLYFYPKPELLNNPVSPAESPSWLASHGYLVFTPNINFSRGYWGPNSLNALDGAAKYLGRLSFVDKKHIGLVGHSNSGRLGYYVLTHSNAFAAMSLGSGHGGTNVLSLALSGNKPYLAETSALEWGEVGAIGNGLGNLWEHKSVWLDHTAVLNADKVSSPLLLFHNKNDGDDVRLAVELFTALRRLQKKMWWLQYDQGEHGLDEIKDQKDFTIRYTQFFDHFLKGAPAPRWMTNGIPYSLKGVERRYDLDPSGNCGLKDKPCIVCNAWNIQYKRNPSTFEKPISEWRMNEDIQEELDKNETLRYKENMKVEKDRIRLNNAKLNGTWREERY